MIIESSGVTSRCTDGGHGSNCWTTFKGGGEGLRCILKYVEVSIINLALVFTKNLVHNQSCAKAATYVEPSFINIVA